MLILVSYLYGTILVAGTLLVFLCTYYDQKPLYFCIHCYSARFTLHTNNTHTTHIRTTHKHTIYKHTAFNWLKTFNTNYNNIEITILWICIRRNERYTNVLHRNVLHANVLNIECSCKPGSGSLLIFNTRSPCFVYT